MKGKFIENADLAAADFSIAFAVYKMTLSLQSNLIIWVTIIVQYLLYTEFVNALKYSNNTVGHYKIFTIQSWTVCKYNIPPE